MSTEMLGSQNDELPQHPTVSETKLDLLVQLPPRISTWDPQP